MRSIFNISRQLRDPASAGQFSRLDSAKRAIFNSHKGFTLIELLIAIVIIGSFGSIVVSILASTFRGSSKTDVVNTVRQNGNYAITEISRMIKYAKIFDGASVNGNTNWTCDIIPPFPTPAPMPLRYKSIRIISFDGITTTFSCESETINATSKGIPVSLMDAAGATGLVILSPASCFFTCQKVGASDSPAVGINFTLKSRTLNDNVEKQATIPFKTSIKLRN